jgi:predicted ester cyclase
LPQQQNEKVSCMSKLDVVLKDPLIYQDVVKNQLDVVRAYFRYCIDGKDVERVGEFFDKNVIVYRTDCSYPLRGLEAFKKGLRENVTDRYETITTSFQKEIVDGYRVVVYLTHIATGSNTWNGINVGGKDVRWTSLTYFEFNPEGKIIEEIVERNELNMARQLGIVEF